MSSFNEIDPRLRGPPATAAIGFPPRSSLAVSAQATSTPNTTTPSSQHVQHESPNIYPHTPQSPDNPADNAVDQDGLNGPQDPNDPKRPRACEACRGLKVRCEPDQNNPDGPCKRCAKARRHCVVTMPSRKRQKKTDSRVAELEKKIDALTASLQATSSGAAAMAHGSEDGEGMHTQGRPNPYQKVTNGGYGSPFTSRPDPRINVEYSGYANSPEYDMKTSSVPPVVVAGQKRKYTESREQPEPSDLRSPSAAGLGRKPADPVRAGTSSGLAQGSAPQSLRKAPVTHEYADVVDRGLITADVAASMFHCFIERMVPYMPAIAFPPGTTAADVRRSKPTLFLAILSASSTIDHPSLQKTLTKEVMSIYADRIICNGEKTLELIQALQVSTIWYWPPEHFEELKFYQLIHIAAVMAIDIGMGKKSKALKVSSAGLWRDHAWRRTPYPDPESIEARRAWLSCYFLCCNASMGLRRPNLVRWTPFMADCIDVLENSPDAAFSDKTLCQWVRSQHIGEEIGTQFSMDDPAANVSIADAKVQHALKGFERDLEKWSSQMPKEVESPILKMTGHCINLYMHEVAMHVDHNVEEFKPPFTEDALRNVNESPVSLTSAHISALSACLVSISGIFDIFLTFDVETIRCLPVGQFVRVAYAVVVLIKMYFAAASPNSELGKVIHKDDMKVETYLDGLVDVFRASAADEKSRPAAKFLMVLMMLKTWFIRQKEGSKPVPATQQPDFQNPFSASSSKTSTRPSTESSNENSKPDSPNPQQQPSSYGPANTPLQLLSELATGNSGGQRRTGAVSTYGASSSDWQQAPQSQQPQQTYAGFEPIVNPMQTPMAEAYSGMNMVGYDPSQGMDLGYTMGDGFEQAMGITLGVGDFGTYFGDGTFFGNVMDPAGGNNFGGY